MIFNIFRAKLGLDKTNNICELWHKHINKEFKKDDNYQNLYKFINVLKAEHGRQAIRYNQWLNGKLKTEPSKDSKLRYEALKNAVENYDSLTVDELKLDWLRNLTVHFEAEVDLAKDY